MDYEVLASQLMRALRGRRSQQAFSRRLGYTANVLYLWEKGRRFPTAGAFFESAQRSRSDARAELNRFLGVELAAPPESSAGVAACLHVLGAGRSVVDLARSVQADRTTVARWLKGETQPRLPELLCWVATTTQRLLEFVAVYADPAELGATATLQRALQAQRELAYTFPWSHAVLRALETREYLRCRSHQPGVLARLVGIPVEEEQRCLKLLAAAGQITRRRGSWRVNKVMSVDTRLDAEKNRSVKRHWAAVGLTRLEHPATAASSALFSYNLFAVSQRDLERIRELHIEYFERVRTIVAACREPERVVLMNQQLIALDEATPADPRV